MMPELHVKRFLEERTAGYSPGSFRHVARALKYYLEFLRSKDDQSLSVRSELIEQFRHHLFYEKAYDRGTTTNYLKALRDFYDYLKAHAVIQENPVKPYCDRLQIFPLRNRSYSDSEIFRSYLANWRKLSSSPSAIHSITGSWKRLQKVMTCLDVKLQTLTRADLEKICGYLDQYRTQKGHLLCVKTRSGALSSLEKILRWMYHNGLRVDNPCKGYHYRFKPHQGELMDEAPSMPSPWQDYLDRFVQDALVRWRPSTVQSNRVYLREFMKYLTGLSLSDPNQINLKLLENYRGIVYAQEHLAQNTRWGKIAATRQFINWLERTDQILVNPAKKMSWPKKPTGLPTRLMSPHEVSMLMSIPDTRSPVGLRNRAIFELMYSTGLRAGEAAGIRLEDIDYEDGLVRVQEPKGGPEYQRVVPIGQIALQWIKQYLASSRDEFPSKPGNERHLFLTKTGRPMNAIKITCAMRQYGIKGGMRKLFSSHSWRVTCATAMLRNRADIRHVQEQLGHRSLNSTKVYTRLFPMGLKKVHQRTHPREREARKMAAKDGKNLDMSAPTN